MKILKDVRSLKNGKQLNVLVSGERNEYSVDRMIIK